MYLSEAAQLRLRKSENVQAKLGELFADRLLVENSDDGVFAVHTRHHRDTEVDRLARDPQLEPSILRHALFGDVELGHHLDARQDRTVEAFGDGTHRRLQHPIDAVLDVDRVVLRLDMDVTGATLDRCVDRRIHQTDDRAAVAGEALDGEAVLGVVVVFENLDLEFFGRLIENALRALTLLEHAVDGGASADHDAHRHPEHHRQLVDHRQIGRVRHDDHQRPAIAAVRHKAVAQHQVGGNRAEQLLINPELMHVEEVEPVALRQPPRRRLVGRQLFGRDLDRRLVDQGLGLERLVGCDFHLAACL